MLKNSTDNSEKQEKKKKFFPLDEQMKEIRSSEKPYWIVLMGTIIVVCIVFIFTSQWVKSWNLSAAGFYAVEDVITVLMMLITGYTVHKIAQRNGGWSFFGVTRIKAKFILAGLTWALLYTILSLIPVFFGLRESSQDHSVNAYNNPTELLGILGLISSTAILVPIVEEFMFRGVMLRTLMMQFNFWPSALISSFIFASLHVHNLSNLLKVIPLFYATFLLGIVNSWLNRKYNSLIPGIIVHILSNSLAVATSLGAI